jgi:hypothetical protein
MKNKDRLSAEGKTWLWVMVDGVGFVGCGLRLWVSGITQNPIPHAQYSKPNTQNQLPIHRSTHSHVNLEVHPDP